MFPSIKTSEDSHSKPYARRSSKASFDPVARRIATERVEAKEACFHGCWLGNTRDHVVAQKYIATIDERFPKEEEAWVKIKCEREQTPEGLFVAQDTKLETFTRVALSTLAADPYASLHSARRPVRGNVDPEEDSSASFGPAKKIAKKGGVLKNVQAMNSRIMDQGRIRYPRLLRKINRTDR